MQVVLKTLQPGIPADRSLDWSIRIAHKEAVKTVESLVSATLRKALGKRLLGRRHVAGQRLDPDRTLRSRFWPTRILSWRQSEIEYPARLTSRQREIRIAPYSQGNTGE